MIESDVIGQTKPAAVDLSWFNPIVSIHLDGVEMITSDQMMIRHLTRSH